MPSSQENLDYLKLILPALKKEKDCVLLNTQRQDPANHHSFLFLRPEATVRASCGEDVLQALEKIENFVKKGFYAAGYLSYEAGMFFEDRLIKKQSFDFPLLWFGIYQEPLLFDHKKHKFTGNKNQLKLLEKNSPLDCTYKLSNLKLSISQRQYRDDIKRIKRLIERGDTYQVNYTLKYKFNFSGSSQSLFLDLSSKQAVSYAAFIKHDGTEILSFSPELFFRKEGRSMFVKPMKGTIARGINLEEDVLKKNILAASQKDRAENIMIVDLLRNDLGRISRTGTVSPSGIFEVEKYQTLFQMVSGIKSNLRKDVTLADIFKSLFPSGSVTGAPKIKTMQIIQSLEKEPRKIYTGSIGFISPQYKRCFFNVAIRTILLDKRRKKAEMGIGSGVVYDSSAYNEYRECKLKGDFLTKQTEAFDLIETFAFKRGKLLFLPLHLKRLKDCAKYFDFKFNKKKIMQALSKEVKKLNKNKTYRLRFLLSKEGKVKCKTRPLRLDDKRIIKVGFSSKKTNSGDIFLYHKTTKRGLYDAEYEKCRKKNLDEVIFTNEKNQITEGAISNILIKKKGVFYTPPVSCGLLNGVYRQFLIKKKGFNLKERILYKKDLMRADKVYLINSVRGMRQASLK